ncbi:hypothetical protein E2320_006303, partial [Naja naja]
AGRGGLGIYLHAMVMCAFPVEVAAVVVDTAVVQGAEPHEAVLQGVVPLLVHVVMPDDVLLTVALWIKAVIMLPVLVCTVDVPAVLAAGKPGHRKKEGRRLCGSEIKRDNGFSFPTHPLSWTSVRFKAAWTKAGVLSGAQRN